MLGNHIRVKDPRVKVQERPMDFNVIEDENFNHMASESTMRQTFKKSIACTLHIYFSNFLYANK